MAARYIYSGAGGAGTGADWANAHLDLAAAITASSAGDTFYVAHDHSKNYGASQSLTFKGTVANPDTILCVNRAGSVPPVAADLTTGALEGTNAASSSILFAGFFYLYGITFAPGSGQTTTCGVTIAQDGNKAFQVFDNCRFRLLSTGGSSSIAPGSSANSGWIKFVHCQVRFGAAGQKIALGGGIFEIISDPSVSFIEAGGTTPTNLFGVGMVINKTMTVRGADLSTLSGTIVPGQGATGIFNMQFINCKLHASATIAATPGNRLHRIDAIGCHSSGNVARNERVDYTGNLTTETTIIRTGGASDGTTGYSWKVVTNGNNERYFPFDCFDGALWNDDTGSSKTLTVHTVTDNVTLTDAEIWLEVEYLGSSATPVSTFATDANATVITTAANQATSSETWTTTGLTTPVKQQLEVTFTPQMAGPIRWRVRFAKTSTTVYICPKAELS